MYQRLIKALPEILGIAIVVALIAGGLISIHRDSTVTISPSVIPKPQANDETSSQQTPARSTEGTTDYTAPVSKCNQQAADQARADAQKQRDSNHASFAASDESNEESHDKGEISDEQYEENKNFIRFTENKQDHDIGERLNSRLAELGCS